MSIGIELIAEERQRQVVEEGWSAAHDNGHTKFELSQAAICYAQASMNDFVQKYWPWDWKWWKPTTRKRNLVKAGALIAAEIDRLERAPN